MHVILLLIGLLALSALPTDAAGRYSIVGIGAESCDAARSGSEQEAASHFGFGALVRMTCNLDSVLLEMQRYGHASVADADDEVASRFGARLHQRVRSHQ